MPEVSSSGGDDWPRSVAKIDDEISQTATKPFAQPTASSVPDSQVRQVQMVLGGRDSKALLLYRTFQTVSRQRMSICMKVSTMNRG